jgi:hypothetical protein
MTALNTQFCTDYDTNEVLDGEPSASLIEASLDAEPTGAVLAYLAEGCGITCASRTRA